MYALNRDFSTSETPLATVSQRNRNFTSRRKLEFQAALENYLSDYRVTVVAHTCRAAPRSVMQRFTEWCRRQMAINRENASYLYNYGRQEWNDRY